jgi:hypothetical protein
VFFLRLAVIDQALVSPLGCVSDQWKSSIAAASAGAFERELDRPIDAVALRRKTKTQGKSVEK